MKYLVTGGGGFIGSHLARELLKRGHTVRIIDNFISGYRESVPEGAELIEKDLCDFEGSVTHFEGLDGVFHIAALPRIPRSIEEPVLTNTHNILPTVHVLEACRTHKIPRVVFASSSTVYGDQARLPLHEDMMPNPISPYGAQKHLCEHYMRLYAMLYGVATVSLRFFSVYGIGMNLEEKYALAIPSFIRARLHNEPMIIFGTGNYTRDCTHVSDVVIANILAMESDKVGKGEVINIGAGHNVSINYLAQLIGGSVEYRDGRKEVKDTHADNSRARELLGWEPKVTIEDGIAEMKKHYGIFSI